MIISHFSDDVWHGTTNEKFEQQLDNQKNGTHEFADCDSRTKLLVKWSDIVFSYNQEENNIVKKSPLDYQTLYPINFEKKKEQFFVNVFNEKATAQLEDDKHDIWRLAFLWTSKIEEKIKHKRTHKLGNIWMTLTEKKFNPKRARGCIIFLKRPLQLN